MLPLILQKENRKYGNTKNRENLKKTVNYIILLSYIEGMKIEGKLQYLTIAI